MRGGTVDDTVLFGPRPTSGNIGHRKGCGGRCPAFGEMVQAVPKVVHPLMIDFKLTMLAQCTNKRPIGTAAPRG